MQKKMMMMVRRQTDAMSRSQAPGCLPHRASAAHVVAAARRMFC